MESSKVGKYSILFLVLGICLLILNTGFNGKGENLDAVSKQKEEAQKEIDMLKEENKQLKSQNNYLQSVKQTKNDKNGYLTWPQVETVADALVQDSGGAFNKTWALYLVKESQKYEIDPHLVYELLKVETGGTFDPDLVGPETKYGRAYGMGQFMKNTAPWVADMAGLPYKEELLFDPYYSMQLSIIYLDFLHTEYQNWNKALTAYHRGMRGLEKYIENNGNAKSWYAVEILSKADSHQTLATLQ
ncbi:lytic transglycosylase domain-containing protein [Sediminibacillus massiliensis]|uniref:lytic transglycosylase domain-containing protein n=1 Tax=Sediminibacillus massiliensis TaxID=1926277 RepID=UPI001FE67E2B|nr:transglycosylase SLT domain-containing protein [Sediminibacillus massiliensis]